MPAPTYTWTDISPASVDQDSEVDVTLWEAMRRNQIFLKEVLYGSGSYVGNVPHTHLGTEDALLSPASTPNLLNDSCPDDGAVAAWTRTGYTSEQDKGFLISTTSGDNAHQIIGRQAALSKAAMGAGADLVLSLFVRAKSTTPTAGELHFGLSDGSAPTTFKAGCKGVIAFGSVTSSWQRFYMALSAATTGSWTTDCRFLLKNHTTPPNQKLIATAFCVNVGRQLGYWEPGLLESESTHDDWQRTGLSDCPVWDERVAITQAVAITGA